MTDRLGYRLKIGIVVPSTNTTVQPETDGMRPKGVTNHVGRIHIPDLPLGNDTEFETMVEAIGPDLYPCIDRVMTCKPAHLIMAMSIPTFWGGKTGSEGRVECDHPAATVGCAVGHGDEIGIRRDSRILSGRRLYPNGCVRVKHGGKPNRPSVRVDPGHSSGSGAGPTAGSPGHAYAGPFSLDQRNSSRQSGGVCDLQTVPTRPGSYAIELRPLIDEEVVDRRPA